MEKVYKSLEEVINEIKNSSEYKEVLDIKEKMNENEELVELIEKVKELQKKYVRTNFDSNIKEELDRVENKLNEIPIYNIYLESFENLASFASRFRKSVTSHLLLPASIYTSEYTISD